MATKQKGEFTCRLFLFETKTSRKFTSGNCCGFSWFWIT